VRKSIAEEYAIYILLNCSIGCSTYFSADKTKLWNWDYV